MARNPRPCKLAKPPHLNRLGLYWGRSPLIVATAKFQSLDQAKVINLHSPYDTPSGFASDR